jgi:type I restriction enzyme, S subunit
MSSWQKVRLGDVCGKGGIQTGPFGSQLHKEDYVSEGTPIITVEHIDNNYIRHINLPYVSDFDKKRLKKYVLRKGDIVFSRVGSVDRRALVRQPENGWLFSGRCLRVRPNPEILDSVYLSYYFALPSFKEYINRVAVGATMPSLNTKILSDVPIHLPPLPEQRAIAHILGSLDDKIEANRRQNETLEATARAIFKSWFVDFDPVHAKARGEHPPGMDAATAALFPDSFEESELGLIPRGWRWGTLDETVQIMGGGTPKTSVPEYWDGDIFWFSVKDVPSPSDVFVIETEKQITQFYDAIVAPILEQIRNNMFESHTLAETRDALLPRLVNGELRVGEIE